MDSLPVSRIQKYYDTTSGGRMRNNGWVLVLILVVSTMIFTSCASRIYDVAYPTLSDGKYDSEFPYKSCSDQLEKIGETIRLLNCIASYKSYIFAQGSILRKDDLTQEVIEKQAIEVLYFNNTTSGTATVISSTGFRVALLTCAHIVSFPDTIISYFPNRDGSPTEYVQSIAFLKSQLNYIADLPESSSLETLLIDRGIDIAVLGKTFEKKPVLSIPVFDYPIGYAKQLEWGTFVYMFGYPLTNKMVTKAIVSCPNKDARASFLLDAVFNRGFSGGIILAIRDGVPNFELVGMVSTVPADYESVIAPSPGNSNGAYDTNLPYHGEVYVNRRINIKYGVTRAISVETLKDFLEKNQSILHSKGYDITSFFKSQHQLPVVP
jgi:hypothetical protein